MSCPAAVKLSELQITQVLYGQKNTNSKSCHLSEPRTCESRWLPQLSQHKKAKVIDAPLNFKQSGGLVKQPGAELGFFFFYWSGQGGFLFLILGATNEKKHSGFEN